MGVSNAAITAANAAIISANAAISAANASRSELVNADGTPFRQPDPGFLADVNSEVHDKGFLVTSTEDLF